MRTFIVSVMGTVAFLMFNCNASPSVAGTYEFDSFSTDTTDQYEMLYWPYTPNTTGANVLDVQFDATNSRAVMHASGRYGRTLMKRKDAVPISSSWDFEFSCDVDILHEYAGGIYIGDLNGNGVELRLDNFRGSEWNVIQAGTASEAPLHWASAGSISSANLKIERNAGIYNFYTDNQLLWSDSLDFLPDTLFYGARNAITSGSTYATTAVDNWEFNASSSVPEPTSFVMFAGLGVMGLVAARRRRRQTA